MAYVTKVEQAMFEARWRALRERIQTSGPRGAVESAALFLRALQEFTHRDTRRYIRGWEMAYNDCARSAGLPDMYRNLSTLRRSQYRDEYVRILVEQNNALLYRYKAKARMLYSWYDSKGRKHDKFYNDQKRKLEKLGKRIDRAAEELDRLLADADGTALLMKNVNRAQVIEGNKLSNVDLSTEDAALKTRLATVRTKVYGGTGKTFGAGNRWFCTMHNLEAHCRVVEWRFNTVAKARAVTGSFGVRRVARTMIERIAGPEAAARRSA